MKKSQRVRNLSRRPLLSGALALALGGAALVAGPSSAAETRSRCDLNGDGYDELVVGAPEESLPNNLGGGMVHVFPGGPEGLEWWRGLEIARGTRHLGSKKIHGEEFGSAVLCDDFNGDGLADLAVGARGASMVFVFPSAPKANEVDFDPPLELRPHVGSDIVYDDFGVGLQSGDLNGDGFRDLVIGARRMVYVVWGTSTGLDSSVAGTVYLGDQERRRSGWGTTAAVGDFDGDGYDDLVFAPNRDSGVPDPRPTVLPGDSRGYPYGPDRRKQYELFVSASDMESYGYVDFGPEGLPHRRRGDRRWTGHATDFNGDGLDDLAIPTGRVGLIAVYLGTPRGLEGKPFFIEYEDLPRPTFTRWSEDLESVMDWSATQELVGISPPEAVLVFRSQTAAVAELEVHQRLVWKVEHRLSEALGISGCALVESSRVGKDGRVSVGLKGCTSDGLGASMSSGDMNGDGLPDLVLGAPETSDLHYGLSMGAVYLLMTDPASGRPTTDWVFRMNPIRPGFRERFGHSVSAADFDGDGKSEIAVGSPDFNSFGAVFVHATKSDGRPVLDLLVVQDDHGTNPSELWDYFGASLP